MKLWTKWALGGASALAIGLFAAGNYFFDVAQARYAPGNHPDALREKSNPLYEDEKTFLALDKQTWHITTKDGLKLDAWYVPAAKPTTKTAVLAHGWHNNKTTMAVYGQLFRTLGYNVLIPDDRAAGDSQGKYVGYGYLDRRDYIQWLNKVVDKNGTDSQIVMMGMSMGAAATMMTAGESDVPTQVKAFIEDAGFTSVKDELSFQAGAMYHIPAFPLIDIVSGISKVRAGYTYGEASALEAVKRNKRPMFFIHGGHDTFVPTKMVYQLYDAAKGPKELWVAPGSEHVQSLTDHRTEYYARVKAFLAKYVK
ncbi:MAG TPA: alpha/beta hydrolase [Lactobacillaceae bacterium]|jgi:hypothetical protein